MNASARLLFTAAVFGLLALIFFSARSNIIEGYERYETLIDPGLILTLIPILIPVLIAGAVMVALLALVASYRVSRATRNGVANQWLLRFTHPEHAQQTASVPWFWAGVFSFTYFAARRVWLHVFLGILFIVFTGGIGNIAQAVFANYIIRKHYEKRGYVSITGIDKASATH